MRTRVEDRFWAKVRKTDGCWLWTGGLYWNGYGSFFDGTRTVRAHRFSYEMLVGPIPKGLFPDHLCRVRSCVYPSHLELVTLKENILRGQGLAAKNSKVTCCPKGHPYEGYNLIHTHIGRYCRTCKNERWNRIRREQRQLAKERHV